MLGDDVMIELARRTFVDGRPFVEVSVTREEFCEIIGRFITVRIKLVEFEGDIVTLDGETGGVVSMLLNVTFFCALLLFCVMVPAVNWFDVKSSNVMISDKRLVPKCDALSEDSDPLGDGGNEFPFELETSFRDCVGEYDSVGDVAEYDSDPDRDWVGENGSILTLHDDSEDEDGMPGKTNKQK